jgi:hypothetical protein
MLLIRVSLALLAALILPASALADLRSPTLGETTTLSDMPASRTWWPSIASDGNTTFVAYGEERGGVTVHRISATGTEIGAALALQSPGTVSVDEPQIVVSGENVYVAWIQGSYWTPETHAVVATSYDGGRTFKQAVMAGPRTSGGGAWDLKLAADGDNVFVAFVDNKDRVWTAGSRDGGRTFPCMAEITVPGDRVDGGGDYDLAVDGDTVIWTWKAEYGWDIWTRRSTDAGRTIEPPAMVYENPESWNYPGSPQIAAGDGVAAIVISKEYRMEREDRSGTDFGWEPEALMSSDRGASWSHQDLGGEESRCVGDYCVSTYTVDIEDARAYVAWRAKGSMWLARSGVGGGFSGASVIGPYLYGGSYSPSLSVRGENVVATWYTGVRPGSWDIDVVGAFSRNHGQTFQMSTIATGEQRDLHPVATAWGPDPAGAGFAWWSWDDNYYEGDTHVKFAPMSAAQPDIEVIDVRPQQVAQDAARLAAGRPTTIRTMLRSRAPIRATISVKVELAYDDENGRVERTIEEDVVVRPGLNPVQLLADDPIKPGQGRITATVTVNPNVADSDPTNNTGEGSRAVVQPRPLKILFVPVAADDEEEPTCTDVRDVAQGTEEFLKAAWPVDPATVSVLTDCSAPIVHPAGLTEAGLMESGMLMSRIDRLKFSAEGVDKVVGVVPTGWFSRQLIDGFEEAVGVAPQGGGLDAAIVERQNTGGWVVAHELAHNYGWTETPGAHDMHLDDEPAPGYWVVERRDIPSSTLDIMQFNTAGADVRSPTGRWMSKKTWDYLTTTLSTGVIQGLAAPGDALSISGSVSQAGEATAGPAYELEGEASVEEGSGPLTFEQLDGDGGVLQTRKFGAVNKLGPIGNATSKGDKPIVTKDAAFSLSVPALPNARSLRIRRGEDVLLSRARSASAPVVNVATPERVELGDDLTIDWTATDADGGTLTSLVSISLDGGQTWRSLGDATTGTSLTIKAIVSIAGEGIRVRVTTTDGWNTTTGESSEFTIGGRLADGLVVFSDFPSGGIWTANMDGSDLKRISDRGNHPRWSPDGRKIVFTDGSNLFTINADGTDRRQLTNVSGQQRYLTPFWTPDGDQIVTEYYRLGSHDAWVQVDPETGEVTPWVQQHGQYCGYTRDGSRIVQWGAWYQFDYALLRADGTDRQILPQPINGRSCMTLSPDNRFGVTKEYRSDSDSRVDIVVWDLQTKEKRNLTNGNAGYQGYSTWSPTGEWILYGSNKDRGGATGYGATDIWKIRPDGTGATKIVDGAAPYHNWEHPDVQPRRGVAPDPEPTLGERKPDARVAAAAAVEGAEIALDASGSRPGADDAALVSYEWDLDGDGVYTDAEGLAPRTTFDDDGTYTVGVLVTDAAGKSATASAEVTVSNAAPTITDARIDDGEPASFSAKVSDPGTNDVQTATVFWNGSETGETVPVIASGDGYVVIASRPGATSAKVVVTDGDGGEAEAAATRVVAPVNVAPSAENASATVVAGEAVDIDLPARDPEGQPLEYEIVDQPASGSVQMREQSPAPTSPDVTYVAGEETGAVTFTYRAKAGGGQSGLATVTVDVTPRPDDPGEVVVPGEPPIAPDQPPVARPSREGTSPVDQRVVEELTGTAPKVITKAEQVATLPSSRSCVSRRNFRIRVKKGDYRMVTVRVNSRRAKVVRGLRDTAMVDLRGLPKGRFKVQIAVTLRNGKVVRSTRKYRTCTPKSKVKKGGRA